MTHAVSFKHPLVNRLITGGCPRACSHGGHGLNGLRLLFGPRIATAKQCSFFFNVFFFLIFHFLFCDSSSNRMLLFRCKWMHVVQHCQPQTGLFFAGVNHSWMQVACVLRRLLREYVRHVHMFFEDLRTS